MKPIAIIFFLIISNILTAQVTQEWLATYIGVGAGSNVPKKCMSDKFGNIFEAGRSENLSYN